MKAHMYQNKAKTITIMEIDGWFFPFISISGDQDNPETLLKLIFNPPTDGTSCHRRGCFASNVEAELYAQEQILSQVEIDKKWGNKNQDYDLGRTQYLYSCRFCVWDLLPVVQK